MGIYVILLKSFVAKSNMSRRRKKDESHSVYRHVCRHMYEPRRIDIPKPVVQPTENQSSDNKADEH